MRGHELSQMTGKKSGDLLTPSADDDGGMRGHDLYATIDAEGIIEEIPRDRIRLGDNIGSGNFGDVWRGILDPDGLVTAVSHSRTVRRRNKTGCSLWRPS
eukprot:Opistho-2@47935